MIKEIGSIFPLQGQKCGKQVLPQGGRVYMSLCREALLHIARQNYANKIVLLPAYTCDTVYLPFLQEGWRLQFYSINRDLRINTEALEKAVLNYKPSVVIAHPYYGYDFDAQELAALSRLEGVTIVVDNTQCVFTQRRYDFANYTVASLRKWGSIPDGAYFEGSDSVSCVLENDSFVTLQQQAMILRGEYFETGGMDSKLESIKLNKEAEALICSNMEEHRMSDFAFSHYTDWNIGEICQKRIANYLYLHERINEIDGVRPVRKDVAGLTTAPLYYPIYCEDRKTIQKKLAAESIYAPVIWPVDDEFVLIDDDVKYIYDHILCLVIDQRYDWADMERTLNVLRK